MSSRPTIPGYTHGTMTVPRAPISLFVPFLWLKQTNEIKQIPVTHR